MAHGEDAMILDHRAAMPVAPHAMRIAADQRLLGRRLADPEQPAPLAQ
jgi:hypothetical protein